MEQPKTEYEITDADLEAHEDDPIPDGFKCQAKDAHRGHPGHRHGYDQRPGREHPAVLPRF